jgi:DNA-directed RNA polymerase specialized sigma24 family protein
MLDQLALKDEYWRKIAFKICKDKMLSDDLVNDMYLKLANCTKEINDFYVIVTIKNLFLSEIKNKKTVSIENFYNFTTEETFEPDDKDSKILENIYWVARDYIELNHTMSLREIGKLLNTDYNYIHKIITNEKKKWQKAKV